MGNILSSSILALLHFQFIVFDFSNVLFRERPNQAKWRERKRVHVGAAGGRKESFYLGPARKQRLPHTFGTHWASKEPFNWVGLSGSCTSRARCQSHIYANCCNRKWSIPRTQPRHRKQHQTRQLCGNLQEMSSVRGNGPLPKPIGVCPSNSNSMEYFLYKSMVELKELLYCCRAFK